MARVLVFFHTIAATPTPQNPARLTRGVSGGENWFQVSFVIGLINVQSVLLSPALCDVCLTSVAYIGPKSRTERPRKTKIGTEVAHVTVTRNLVTTFKVKRSKVKVTSGQRGNIVLFRLAPGVRRFGAH